MKFLLIGLNVYKFSVARINLVYLIFILVKLNTECNTFCRAYLNFLKNLGKIITIIFCLYHLTHFKRILKLINIFQNNVLLYLQFLDICKADLEIYNDICSPGTICPLKLNCNDETCIYMREIAMEEYQYLKK